MNINHKIKEVGGRTAISRKFNELIKSVNWLLGMRSVTGAIPSISESSTGPIITIPFSPDQQQPWAIDPNGSVTGWTLITYLDGSGNLNDMYVWSGQNFNPRACS